MGSDEHAGATRLEYSQNWSEHFASNAAQHWAPLKGRPLRYLEIGVFEGRGSRWMLENVLTHPDSRLVGIDAWPFDGDPFEGRARANLAEFSERVELIKGRSTDVLRHGRFEDESFDLIYIDGDHRALAAMSDSVLTWPLLKVGGLCTWDDYKWRRAPWKRTPRHERPGDAIDAFIHAIKGQFEPLFRNYQLGVRKTQGAAPPPR